MPAFGTAVDCGEGGATVRRFMLVDEEAVAEASDEAVNRRADVDVTRVTESDSTPGVKDGSEKRVASWDAAIEARIEASVHVLPVQSTRTRVLVPCTTLVTVYNGSGYMACHSASALWRLPI